MHHLSSKVLWAHIEGGRWGVVFFVNVPNTHIPKHNRRVVRCKNRLVRSFKLYFLVRRFKTTPLLLLLCQPAAKFSDQVKAVIITMMKWILLGKLKLQCRLMCIDKVLINVMIL